MFQCFNENIQIYKTVLRWKLENGSRIIFLKYEFERMEYVQKKCIYTPRNYPFIFIDYFQNAAFHFTRTQMHLLPLKYVTAYEFANKILYQIIRFEIIWRRSHLS